MGAKTWMLAYVNGNAGELLKSYPQLDRERAISLAQRLFPNEKLETIKDRNLCFTCPPDDEIYIGCYPGISIIAAKEFSLDYPSKLNSFFLNQDIGRKIYLHAMHSVVDWFAYAIWIDGKLQRSLSLSPDNGIIEDIGEKLKFEELFWSGNYYGEDPEVDYTESAFLFHPLDLGEQVLLELFGYQLEGDVGLGTFDPEKIPLAGFKRKKSWWKFWFL
jgi:hypothetical protein